MRTYTITYDLVTPESARLGDVSECGFVTSYGVYGDRDVPLPDGICGEEAAAWMVENKVQHLVTAEDWFDYDADETLASCRYMASIIIDRGCTETNSAPSFYQSEGSTDMHTGAERTEAIHLEGWSHEELDSIIRLVNAGSADADISYHGPCDEDAKDAWDTAREIYRDQLED